MSLSVLSLAQVMRAHKSVIFEIKLVFPYFRVKLPTNKYINYTIRHTIKKNTWRSDDETNINLNKFNLYGN